MTHIRPDPFPIPWLVTHVFDGLSDRELIKVSQSFVGYRQLTIWWVSPKLKRQLRD